jgi:hypothetical protein
MEGERAVGAREPGLLRILSKMSRASRSSRERRSVVAMFGRYKGAQKGALPAHRLPPSTVYRRFLYLDVDGMMNFLSVLRGGEVLDRYQVGVSESKGGLGAEIGLGSFGIPASVRAGAQKRRSLEEQVRLTTTAHSAFAEILIALEENEQRCVISSAEDLRGLTSNRLIELPYRRVERIDPELEDPAGKRDDRSWLKRRLAGDESKPPREFSALLDTEAGRAAIVGDGKYLLVGGDQLGLLRHATAVGQVEIPSAGREVVCRDAGGSPGGPVLRDVSECAGGADPYCTAEVLLSPICIYK